MSALGGTKQASESTSASATYRRSQGKLKVDRLEVAVGKVGGEFEPTDDVVRLLRLETSALNLHRHTEDVLATGVDDAPNL